MKTELLSIIEQNNITIYSDPIVVSGYKSWSEISSAEALALGFIDEIKKNILDIGCGAGRHASFFANKNVDYLGIDISSQMIEAAKNRFPEMNFEVKDAFSLNPIDKKYDCILIMHNGLDLFYPYSRRLQILKKIANLLTPNGVFIFSSHTPDWYRKPFQNSQGFFNQIARLKKRLSNSQKGYLPELYRNKRIWQFRASPSEIQNELFMCDLQVQAIFPDYCKTPFDWYYYVAFPIKRIDLLRIDYQHFML